MYVFGIVALLGVGAFAVAAFADRYLSMAREFWAMTCMAFGIGLTWLADFNLWSLWHMSVRALWVGSPCWPWPSKPSRSPATTLPICCRLTAAR
jgi:hypothetical protein